MRKQEKEVVSDLIKAFFMTIIAWRTPFSDSRSKLKKIFLDRQFAFFL